MAGAGKRRGGEVVRGAGKWRGDWQRGVAGKEEEEGQRLLRFLSLVQREQRARDGVVGSTGDPAA